MASAESRKIIGGGAQPIKNRRWRRPGIVGGGVALPVSRDIVSP